VTNEPAPDDDVIVTDADGRFIQWRRFPSLSVSSWFGDIGAECSKERLMSGEMGVPFVPAYVQRIEVWSGPWVPAP
jgi:hypothetical protein